MSLGGAITALQVNKLSRLPAKWITRIYVVIDLLCLLSQLAGTVMPASGEAHLIELSRKIIFGGLLVQLVALAFFCYLAWHITHVVAREEPKMFAHDAGVNWKAHFRTIFATASLVLVRSLIRAVEYGQGEQGFIISHEVFIYLFDAAPMWLAMVAYLWIHPSRLRRDAYLLLNRDMQLNLRELL